MGFRIKKGYASRWSAKSKPPKLVAKFALVDLSEQRADPGKRSANQTKTADLIRPRGDSKNPGSAFGVQSCVRSVLNFKLTNLKDEFKVMTHNLR